MKNPPLAVYAHTAKIHSLQKIFLKQRLSCSLDKLRLLCDPDRFLSFDRTHQSQTCSLPGSIAYNLDRFIRNIRQQSYGLRITFVYETAKGTCQHNTLYSSSAAFGDEQGRSGKKRRLGKLDGPHILLGNRYIYTNIRLISRNQYIFPLAADTFSHKRRRQIPGKGTAFFQDTGPDHFRDRIDDS